MKLNTLVRFLNKELRVRKIADSSRNGLQVRGRNEVKKVGVAVDGCLSTFEKAKKVKCDLVVVHHGVKWSPQKRRVINKRRENFLKRNKMSLYGVHLPLDAHSKYGNNMGLTKILDLKKVKKFGGYRGFKIGYKGQFEKAKGLGQIVKILNKSLKAKCMIYPFGKKKIKTIGIVSGNGECGIGDAVKEKVDCFLLGEFGHSACNWAKDDKLSVIVGGHYYTETVGVKALQKLLKEKFGLQTVFIDNPTGI